MQTMTISITDATATERQEYLQRIIFSRSYHARHGQRDRYSLVNTSEIIYVCMICRQGRNQVSEISFTFQTMQLPGSNLYITSVHISRKINTIILYSSLISQEKNKALEISFAFQTMQSPSLICYVII